MLDNVKGYFKNAWDIAKNNPESATILGLSAIVLGIATGANKTIRRALPKALKGTTTRRVRRYRRRIRTRVVYVRPRYFRRRRRY